MVKLTPNPNNPRTITKDKFEKLKKSIREFPKMLDIRPIIYDENLVILGGNMRYKALCELEKEGFEIKDTWFLNVNDLTETQKKEFVVKDNAPFGEWDWDLLANEWGDLPLGDWGLNTYKIDEPIDVNELWKEAGMPDYGDPSGKKPFRSIMLHFENQEQVNEFAKLIGQTITDKTKFIWFRKNEP